VILFIGGALDKAWAFEKVSMCWFGKPIPTKEAYGHQFG
jgi:hypothetical protein